MLRAFITGGGCSGFQYGFTFEEDKRDDDTAVMRSLADDDSDDGEGSAGGNGGIVSKTDLNISEICLLIDPKFAVFAWCNYRLS